MKYCLCGGAVALPAVLAVFGLACSSASSPTKTSEEGGTTLDAGMPEAASTGTTFADIYPTLIGVSCTNANCHNAQSGATAGALDMSSQTVAFQSLVNIPAGGTMGGTECSGMGLIRVVPGSPSTSLMYLKVSEDSPPCGAHMPFGGTPLTVQQQSQIQTWIADGAKE